MMKRSSNQSHNRCTRLIAPAVLANITAQENAYKSQHETILAELNRYTTATRLVIILMDEAIKHTCVWPLA